MKLKNDIENKQFKVQYLNEYVYYENRNPIYHFKNDRLDNF